MKFKIDIKIVLILVIFKIVNQMHMYILFMLFATIHEIFHLITGILLGYKMKSIKIMAFGLSIDLKKQVNKLNVEMNNLKEIIILFMGPFSNIIISLIFYFIGNAEIVYINILIAIFNLLPIYPLDGGQILNRILRIFYDLEESYEITAYINNIIMAIITAIASIGILYLKNISIAFMVIFMWYLVISERRKMKEFNKCFKYFHKLDKKSNYNI